MIAPVERPGSFIVFFKDEITKFMFPQHFKNYVADIEIHSKKVKLVCGIQKDRKIRTGYDLFPVPTSDKKRNTAGKRKAIRRKRRCELGRPPANTKIRSKHFHTVRTSGGNQKFRALRLDSGNYSSGSESVTCKSRIIDVV